jgi:hypothetical protein
VEWGGRLLREACAPELPDLELAHALWDDVFKGKRVLTPPVQDLYLATLIKRRPQDSARIEHVRPTGKGPLAESGFKSHR